MSAQTALAELLESAGERRFGRVGLWGSIRAEAVKLSRMRANYVMTAAGIALFAFTVFVLAAAPGQRDLLRSDPMGFWARLLDVYSGLFQAGSGIFLLIAGARLAGQEYGYGTVRVVLARGEARLHLWVAKLAVLGLLALLLLGGFSLLALAATVLGYNAIDGSTARLTSLPAAAWTDLRINYEVQFMSMAIACLLGTAAGVVGRSMGFALGAGLALFPADNFGTIVMSLLTRLTGNQAYAWATAYFLGPNLNVAANRLEADHLARPAFAAPLVVDRLDANHVLAVIAAWALGLIAVSVVLLLRRDVLE